ncbi:polynucleotide adenylyltransferase PcnB [Hydrogenovibrio sp. JE_KL2]|uniref:polynucleotide adenylyltransferase PcnB n=1 Tax=Hydrogenovibrio sp. JE_KL2 TaxID=2651188 RepID=UPI00128C166A|nr:polynucleotide adenylyltransferase PcnB [Hydrogenovibrio sp. JE_KL2]MPQ76909.1 polynucleotide adenylyltransferase PcnB [Hydrogenovibrio sp. JE_KL2]
MQRLIRKVASFFSKAQSQPPYTNSEPDIISRKQHSISREQIDKGALDVLYGLKRAGYEAYLVGGAVRDLLLGLEPKDFDIVTNAEPEEIKAVFRQRCRLIGRRFRLAHVHFGRNVIEVATFRGAGDAETLKPSRRKTSHSRAVDETGRLVRDNVYGTIDEDIWRRDFTVNSLYYNIKDFSIVDYAGALRDIKKGQLRLIGDPETRYREDPVRMIRAVRFAAKLGFEIESKTKAPLYEMGHLLKDVSNARMFEEVLKLFHSGVAIEVFEKLRHFGLFTYLFPQTHHVLSQEEQGFPRMLVVEALKSTDARIQSGKGVNPSFLFAAMLWEPMLQRREQHLSEGFTHQDALYAAANDVIEQQIVATSIPKRFSSQIREIWSLQFRLARRSGTRAQRLFEHPRFRAAYDFLGIRAAAGETSEQELFDWWTQYQEKDAIDQVAFANDVRTEGRKPRRPRRGRNPYRKRSSSTDAE